MVDANQLADDIERLALTDHSENKKTNDEEEEGLTSLNLTQLLCHKRFKTPKSQLDYYREHNASSEILPYVSISGKSFGEKNMEQIAKEYFKLDNKTDSSHDHRKMEKTIEQKSARYHANGGDWKWQHIEMEHEWDFLLLCGLDFESIKFYITSRETVEKLIKKGVITGQGKQKDGVAQPQQAYWFSRSNFKKKNIKFEDYFVELYNETSMLKYLNTF